MAKYRVYIDQVVQFYRDIEAVNEEEAELYAVGSATSALVEYNRLNMEIREDLTEEIDTKAGEGST